MEKKFIDWEKDENGIDVGKWTVPTIYEEERLQKIFDKINELEERVKTLENKTK